MADILIRGMEIPKNCSSCKIICWNYLEYGINGILRKLSTSESRDPNCPLVPLQEGHGRLIDGDALERVCKEIADCEWNKKAAPYSWEYAYNQFIDDEIFSAPTIIEADLEWKMKNCCCFSNTDQAEGGGEEMGESNLDTTKGERRDESSG